MTDNFEDLYTQAHSTTSEAAPPADAGSSNFADLYDQAHSEGAQTASPSSGAEWGDVAKAGKATMYDMAGRAMTGAQWLADKVGTQSASEANRQSAVDMQRAAEEERASMSDTGQKIANAAAIPTEGGSSLLSVAVEHPLATVGIKGAQIAGSVVPYVAAGAIGGLPAEVAMGAVDQASSSMQAAIGKTNEMTDDELAQASPRFAQLMKETPDPYQARVKFREELYTTPQLAADIIGGGAIGWITGRTLGSGKAALGVEKVAEKGANEAERSALRTMGEQAAGNAAGAASTDYTQQRADAVQQDASGQTGQTAAFAPNVGQMATAAVNSGVEGALAAGAPHGVGWVRGKLNEQVPVPQVEKVTEAGGDAAQTAALKPTQQEAAPPPPAQPSVTPAANQPAPAPSQGMPVMGEMKPITWAEPTPAPAPAAGPVDGGMNTPEKPETLAAQEQAQAEGRKDVVAYPGGKGVPKLEPGMAKVAAGGVTYVYRQKSADAPDGFTAKQIRAAHDDGSIAGLLNPAHEVQPKAETLARAAQGEPVAAAVTEKPDGTEVEASAGTLDTIPAKMAAQEAVKAPDEIVTAKPIPEVLAAREEPSAPVLNNTENLNTTAPRVNEPNPAPVTSAANPEPAKPDAYAELQSRLAAVQAAWDPEVSANPPHSAMLRRWEQLAKNIAGDAATYTRNPVIGFLTGKLSAAEARDKVSRPGKHGQTDTSRKLEGAFNALVQHVLSQESHVKLDAGEAMRRDDAMSDLNRGIRPDRQPTPTPAPETLPKVEVTRTTKAQDIINKAKGIEAADAPAPVAPKPTVRRAKPREEQKAGKATSHELRARADANRIGIEVATKHKLDDATLEAAAKGDPDAVKRVVATARKMVDEFHAAAKDINTQHSATRTGVAKTTLAKEQVKIPKGYATHVDESRAHSAGLAMVMEARSLINKPKAFLQQFLARHGIAHGSDLTKFNADIYNDRQAAGGEYGAERQSQAAQKAAEKAGVEGETSTSEGVDNSDPESILAAKQTAEALASGKLTEEDIAPAPRAPTPKKEPGQNTVVKESFAEERAKQQGETRAVAETDKERIAREAMARLAQKDAGVKAPEPKPEPKREKTKLELEQEKWNAKLKDLDGDAPDNLDYMTTAMERNGISDDAVLEAMGDHIDAGDKFVTVGTGKNKKSVAIHETVKPKDAVTKADALAAAFTPDEKLFMPIVHNRMMELTGDVKVHLLEDTPYNRANVADHETGMLADGFYDPVTNAVYAIKQENAEANTHVLMHEIGHAATSKAIDASPELKADIDTLITHLKENHGGELSGSRPGGGLTYLDDAYGLKNAKEFIAEFQGNYDFREALRHIQLPAELAKKLGLGGWSKGTVYDAVINLFRKALNLPPKATSALEAALALTDRAHTIQERVKNGESTGAIDYMAGGSTLTMRRIDKWKQDTGLDKLLAHANERTRKALGKVAFTHDLLRAIDARIGGDLGFKLHTLVEGQHSLETQIRNEFAGPEMTRKAEQLRQKHEDFNEHIDLIDSARLAGVDLDAGPEQFKGSGLMKAPAEAWYNANKSKIEKARKNTELWDGLKEIRDTFDRMHTEAGVGRIAQHWTNYISADKPNLATDEFSQKKVRELAERFYKNSLTDGDKKRLGLDDPDLVINGGDKKLPEHLRQMFEARSQFNKENNTYRPFHREGTHWAYAKRRIEFLGDVEGKKGELLNDSTVQFTRAEGETKTGFEDRVKRYMEQMQVDHGFDVRDAERVTLDPKDPTGPTLEKESADGVDGARIIFSTSYADKAFGGVAAKDRLAAMTHDESRDLPFKLKDGKYTVGGKEYTFFDPKGSGVGEVDPHTFDSSGARALSPRLTALAKRLEGQIEFDKLSPEAQAATRRGLLEAALLGRTGSSALGTHTISDRKVRGFAKNDFSRVVADYVDQAARDIAATRQQPQIDATRERLQSAIKKYVGSLPTGADRLNQQLILSEQFNEVKQRYDNAKADTTHRLVRDLLHLTSLDKLANVAFNVVNAMEAPIMGGTMIAGRHGIGATYTEMAKVGREIGSLGVVKKAAGQTLKARDILARHRDYGRTVEALSRKRRMENRGSADAVSAAKDVDTVMEYFGKTGLVSPEAEYFFAQENRPRGNKLEKILATTDRMGRQMTMGVETINRALTGITAYRLEKAKLLKEHKAANGDREPGNAAQRKIEEAALKYAYNTTIDTMGNYSKTNSSSLFGGALGPALQFRKYGIKTYTLMGKMLTSTLKKLPEGDTPEAKAQREQIQNYRKAFAGLIVVQWLTSGLSGLPFTEVGRTTANILNLAKDEWGMNDDEWEENLREFFSGVPASAREFLIHGVGRLMGVDLGGKLGMGNLSGVKVPKSASQQDIAQWIGEMLSGASLSTVTESVKGVMGAFDDTKSATQRVASAASAVPVKIVSDMAKGISGSLEAPETKRGLEKAKKYSPMEGFVKGIGFTPAREASEREQRGIDYTNKRKYQDADSHIKQKWLDAKTGAERTAVLAEMREFNKTVGRDARLSAADLVKYKQSHDKLNREAVLGQTVTKKTKPLFDKTSKLFGAY